MVGDTLALSAVGSSFTALAPTAGRRVGSNDTAVVVLAGTKAAAPGN